MVKLKSLREERKINQQKIAMDLQISQASISKYELGNTEPDIATILKLADYFHVSTDYLLGKSKIKMPMERSDLSETEIDLLVIYKSLSSSQKERINAYMQGICEFQEETI